MIQRQKIKHKILRIYLLFFLLSGPVVVAAADADKENLKKGPEHSSMELLQTVKNTVAVENGDLEELNKRLARLETLQKAVFIEINAYNIQNSAYGNLLLQPTTPVTALEKAFNENRLALNAIDDKIKDFTKRRDSVDELRRQAQDQIGLNAKQVAEIKSSDWPKSEKTTLLADLRQLDHILAEKLRVIQNLLEGLDPIVKQLEAARISTSQLNGKLEQQITTRKARELFSRKYMLLKVIKKESVAKEFAVLATNLTRPFQKDFWRAEGRRIRETAAMSFLILTFLTAVVAVLAARLRRYCVDYEERPFVPSHRWRFLCVRLIRRSLFFLGILFVLYSYNILQLSHYRFPIHRPVFNILLIFLFSRWVLDFFKWRQHDESFSIFQKLGSKIRRMTKWVRYFAVAYVVILWIVGEDSLILFVGRLFIEIYLTACCVTFWRAFRNTKQPPVQGAPLPRNMSHTPMEMLSYLITLGALVIELAGYPAMALYWLVSWARSLAVLFWATILFRVILEWRSDDPPPDVSSDAEPPPPAYPIRQLFVSVCWLMWFCGVILTLILAWSTQMNMFVGVYTILSKSVSIGNIHLSSLGLFFAVLILFLTLILTRLARYLLAEKMFVESSLEPGFQHSITTITIYVMWGLGVIMALGVLGVSATSLAVVFGALSIGIGFGLQNIFNNFISGIILLFERPIQVGDAVEIGGIWGEVRRINVRATVVQTFDNASLIIPNSEFISSQVTNWSFKEPSLRRNLEVGVAYGSDVELVRKTLLEIASQTPNVRKKPKPDVIFFDHGDSALIFRLRYWTTIDNYYSTWSDIRFSIDRLFREKNIEIAFPQRDIHIRSTVKDNHFAPNAENNNLAISDDE